MAEFFVPGAVDVEDEPEPGSPATAGVPKAEAEAFGGPEDKDEGPDGLGKFKGESQSEVPPAARG
eukprot:11158709-Lingulodinium_polyedra.AAC.1